MNHFLWRGFETADGEWSVARGNDAANLVDYAKRREPRARHLESRRAVNPAP